MWAISARQVRAPGRDRQPAEHPLVDEPHLAALVGALEREPDPQVPLVGRRGRLDQDLAAHAEVAEQRVAVVERQPEVLAAAAGRLDPAAGQRRGEAGRAARVTAHRTRVQHLDAR